MMRTPTVLVVCPTHRDHRELARLPSAGGLRLCFHDYALSLIHI